MAVVYKFYVIEKENDHYIAVGPDNEFTADTVEDAKRTIDELDEDLEDE